MPNFSSAERLSQGAGNVLLLHWDPWVELPEFAQSKFGLREWNAQQRRRDESNRDKLQQELNRLQAQIKDLGG